MKAARKLRILRQPQSLIGYVRQLLTPTAWKQARRAVPRGRAAPRWDLQPLVVVLLAMTWVAGDSESERFEKARGYYVACYEGRRRPGATLVGLQKALRRAPMRQLRALAAGVRRQIRARLGARRLVDGFEPMGGDGSRIECPRTPELERGLGQAGKADAAPNVWLTALVHLPTGLLRSWRLGPGTAAEQEPLRHLLATASAEALIVCDAAYMGFVPVEAILGARRSFLFRMSSRVDLYTLGAATLGGWTEGPVLYWPNYVQKKGRAPIRCRLIRVPARGTRRGKGSVRRDVWLLTDVLDPARLSAAAAARFYRWRWRNEGMFRTYKRTVKKLKRTGRTVALVHREAELSLLAAQVLLAHADLALRPATAPDGPVISPRKVLIAIRKEIDTATRPEVKSYRARLSGCHAEARKQSSPKSSRKWPRRKPTRPPKPPRLHTLSEEQKVLLNQHMRAVG